MSGVLHIFYYTTRLLKTQSSSWEFFSAFEEFTCHSSCPLQGSIAQMGVALGHQ